jgi:hypothetical protein
MSNDIVSGLEAYDVIITTYGEVQRSYLMTDPLSIYPPKSKRKNGVRTSI